MSDDIAIKISIQGADGAAKQLNNVSDSAKSAAAQASNTVKNTDALSGSLQNSVSASQKATSALAGVAKEMDNTADSAQGAANNSKGFFDKIGGIAGNIKNIALVATGAVAGIAVLGNTLNDLVASTEDDEVAEAKVASALIATNKIRDISTKSVTDYANALAGVSNFTDEVISTSSSVLLRFESIGSDIFPKAQQAALDLAEGMGQDLVGASRMLGTALNNPIEGISQLKAAGVNFNKEEVLLITNMVAAGKTAEAQQVLLDNLADSYGGAALAASQTLSGQRKQWADTVDAIKESLGGIIRNVTGDTVPTLLNAAKSVMTWLQRNSDTLTKIAKVIIVVVGGALKFLWQMLKQGFVIFEELSFIAITAFNVLTDSAMQAYNNIKQVIYSIGQALFKLATGDFAGAKDAISNGITDIVKTAKDAFSAGGKITSAIKESADRINEYGKETAAVFTNTITGVADAIYGTSEKVTNVMTKPIAQGIEQGAQAGMAAAAKTIESYPLDVKVTPIIIHDKFNDDAINTPIVTDVIVRVPPDLIEGLLSLGNQFSESFKGATKDIFLGVINGTNNMRDVFKSLAGNIGNVLADAAAQGLSEIAFVPLSKLLSEAGGMIISAVANIYRWFSKLPPPIGIPLAIAGGGAIVGGFLAAKKQLGFKTGGIWDGGEGVILSLDGRRAAAISEDGQPERIGRMSGLGSGDDTAATVININAQVLDERAMRDFAQQQERIITRRKSIMRGGIG